MSAASQSPSWRDIVTALRPNQWTKNAVVLAAAFFAFGDRALGISLIDGLRHVLPAALLFCLVSSGVYLLNDVRDREADRTHPRKRNRPVAAGRLAPSYALMLALILFTVGLSAAWGLSQQFAVVLCTYLAIQLFYSFGLKHIALLDVFIIAAGFVLRAIAGAVVLAVPISPWLLLCTFLLALFLALCKRRQEKLIIDTSGGSSRRSLEAYDERVLDQLIAISAGAAIVAYAIYTMSAETVEKFGTSQLGFTVPFVIFGIFRYMDLAYRLERGERPEKVLLTDGPLIVDILLYVATVVVIFLNHR